MGVAELRRLRQLEDENRRIDTAMRPDIYFGQREAGIRRVVEKGKSRHWNGKFLRSANDDRAGGHSVPRVGVKL